MDEGERSSAKMARVEKSSISQVSDSGKNISSVKVEDSDILSLDDMDFDTEPSVVSKEKPDFSNGRSKGNNEASTPNIGKDESIKRKQTFDDDVVEESDLENDDDGAQDEQKISKAEPFMVKRQRLDSGEDSEEDILAGLLAKSSRNKVSAKYPYQEVRFSQRCI